MDKYTLLVILNAPFIIFGLLKAYVSYNSKIIKLGSFLLRILFWAFITFGLVFANNIYDYLIRNRLTDSGPLTIADVVQITGIIFCLSLILRLYSKLEATERQLVKLHQELSLRLSDKNKT